MPIYEYHCDECGHDSELLVTSNSKPDCPECGSPKMSKLLSIVAAPTRESSSARPDGPPSGGCGGGCACHPH